MALAGVVQVVVELVVPLVVVVVVVKTAQVKPRPFTVRVKSGASAIDAAGEMELIVGGGLLTLNGTAKESPPPGGGFSTAIWAVPGVCRRLLGTAPKSLLLLTKVVERFWPFQVTTEVVTKLLPFTVRLSPEPPTRVPVGWMEVMEGTGLVTGLMVKL